MRWCSGTWSTPAYSQAVWAAMLPSVLTRAPVLALVVPAPAMVQVQVQVQVQAQVRVPHLRPVLLPMRCVHRAYDALDPTAQQQGSPRRAVRQLHVASPSNAT